MIRYRLRQPNFVELLAVNDLTITDAARELKLSRSYLSQLISGARFLSARVRRRMRTREPFRQVDRTELFERVEPPQPAQAKS